MRYVHFVSGKSSYNNTDFSGREFPAESDLRQGNSGYFVKINGTGFADLPQRNFKVTIADPIHAVFFTIKDNLRVWTSPAPENYTLPSLDTLELINKVSNNSSGPVISVRDENSHLTDKELCDIIQERFSILNDMTIGSAKGIVKGLIVSGAPGVGKSFEITRCLENYGALNVMEDDIPDFVPNQLPTPTVEVVKGYLNDNQLYAKLYNNRNKNQILILDDCDAPLMDKTSIQLLKSALDTSTKRIIHWGVSERRDGIPTHFEYNGTIIVITNLNLQKIVDSDRSDIAKHIEAILDRSMHIDMHINTLREKMIRIDYVVKTLNMLEDKGYSTSEVDELMLWVKENAESFSKLSLRKILQVATIYKMSNNWQNIAKVTLLSK